MFESLDIMPDSAEKSELYFGLKSSIIQKPQDPNTMAAAFLWDLYLHFYDTIHGRISPTRADLESLSLNGHRGGLCMLGLALGKAGRGAGLFIFSDRSCLAVRTRDGQAWGDVVSPARVIDIVPVVLNIGAIVVWNEDISILATIQTTGPWARKVSGDIKSWDQNKTVENPEEIIKSFDAQLCWEATSWGCLIDGLPSLDPEAAWPAAFPQSSVPEDRLAALIKHAEDASRHLIGEHRDTIKGLHLRIVAGRQMQGCVSPAYISVRFIAVQDQLHTADSRALQLQLQKLIFGGPQFPADSLISQKMGKKDDVHTALKADILCQINVVGTPSAHERLQLHETFPSS